MTMKGADAVLKALEQEGVEVVFGIPGGASMPIYDPLVDRSPIRHVLCRHEQGAGHAAEGYAWATGKVGVCMATSGPGATNLVTPLTDAKMDSVPIVAITGQVPTPVVGNDAFQEADITGITMPVTKHNFLVKNPADIVETVREAFHIASTGRPGPVLIDLPKDVLQADVEYTWPEKISLPGYRPTTKGNNRQVSEAVKLILAAKRPVLYVGGGVIKANATDELRQLAELGKLPVVTTLMARGAFPDSHELCLGMPGMHGVYTAVTAMQRADLLVALGARFDDRVTGKLSAFAPDAKIVHVDIDPAEIGKNRVADVPIVGDCRDVIAKMVTELGKRQGEAGAPDRSAWLDTLKEWQAKYPLRYGQTAQADWAVLTVTESLPAEIEPLRLRREPSPSGTKAVLVGYPRDRAFAMTADRDCELRDKISAGRLLLHTCRSTFGYSGGPILVGTGGREMEVAGIQIASPA